MKAKVGGWLKNAVKHLLPLLLLETLIQIFGGKIFSPTKWTSLPMILAHCLKCQGWNKKINSVFTDFK